MIAVGVLGSLGDELDPVLDLGHPGIHAVAGALAPIAHHTNLGESKYIIINYNILLGIFIIHHSPSVFSNHKRASRVSLA